MSRQTRKWSLRCDRPTGYCPNLKSIAYCAPIAVAIVPRIHSETVFRLARAANSMRFRSSALKRTGTIRPLASPFGSFGRPIFGLVCFAIFPEFLQDHGLDGGLWREDRPDMQYRYIAFWTRWIVCRVYPSVDLVRAECICHVVIVLR